MGWVYRRRIRLGKNAWINLSKRGASLSGRAGRVTLNSRGRSSVRVARGVSYRNGCLTSMCKFALAVIACVGVLASCSSSKPSSKASTSAAGSTTEGAVTSATATSVSTTTGATTTTAPPGTTTTIPTTPPQSCSTTSGPANYDAQNGYYSTAPKTVDAAAGTLRYDVVQFLLGDDAKRAWQHDNPTDPEGPPNDYYVVNVSPRIYSASFAPGVRVFDVDPANPGNPTLRTDTLAGFVSKVQSHMGSAGTYEGDLFWVRLGGGKITELCEQWVP